ncbi:hypothetical protein AVEN_182068-1 [Araneus ventricosus]|uniref:Uncharacterized protein n=1 Tax=Araneus ventricosus TaxID=182803 RepID=A0A4Y2NRQ6_ARAVE|nr:hypothetical protein AVEN_182068-1 [Araneus ventricosus]
MRFSLPNNWYRDSSRVKFDTRKHSVNNNPSARLPTADTSSFATNFIATSGDGEGNELCPFCGQPETVNPGPEKYQPSHSTSRCVWARGKSHSEIKDILMKKGVCFRCLKDSRYLSRDCKAKLNPSVGKDTMIYCVFLAIIQQ